MLKKDENADENAIKKALEITKKRSEGFPLQYLLGDWEFYGLKFKVGEGVLIPRQDTEILVDAVLTAMKSYENKSPKIIDLCSGSGCIAVSLKKNMPCAEVFAVELSSEAFPYLVHNVAANGVDVKLLKGDVMNGELLDNFKDPENFGDYQKLDAIISNPPYLTDKEMRELQKEVSFEPESALRGGIDGLKFYRVISRLWGEILADNGFVAFEIGFEQGTAVTDILQKSGFYDVKVTKDYAGNDRVVTGYKTSDA